MDTQERARHLTRREKKAPDKHLRCRRQREHRPKVPDMCGPFILSAYEEYAAMGLVARRPIPMAAEA